VVLDAVAEADDLSVVTATRLLPPERLRQEAEEIAGDIEMDWNWYRATRRRYQIRTVLASAAGVGSSSRHGNVAVNRLSAFVVTGVHLRMWAGGQGG